MKILLVEDDLRLNSLIQQALTNAGFSCVAAHDGLQGKLMAEQQSFDLIVSDIMLPKMNGLDMVKAIREMNKHIPILMLSALGDTDDKIQGFDLGADDYLVKPFEMRELLARIRALLKRSHSRQQTETERLSYSDLEMNLHTKIVSRAGIEIRLTPKEFKLLEYFLKNPERVLSRNEIAEKVWDTHFDTGTNFIDVYINYLRKKVEKDFDKKLIHTKSGMGFILTAL